MLHCLLGERNLSSPYEVILTNIIPALTVHDLSILGNHL